MSHSPAPDFSRFVLSFPQPRTDADNTRLALEYALVMGTDDAEGMRVTLLGGEQPDEFKPLLGDMLWVVSWQPSTATYEWVEIEYQPEPDYDDGLPLLSDESEQGLWERY